ncbi:MAG: HDOD domain-containing protein, partial [bacterium]
MKKRILFVDDDPHVLRGIQRMLFNMTDEWAMEFVDSGHKALEALTKAPFDVIISDMRMPGIDGAELLNEVLKRQPLMVRIILSGQSDKQMIMKSIGPTHQFLSKPLNGEKLKEILVRAFALRDLLTDDKLKILVSRLKSLPSLPSLYHRLMIELQSPDVPMHKLGEIIAQDVGMTAKMLQLVNSSFFGLPVHVSDPIHAARLLGAETLKALVLSVQIFSKFDQVKLGGLSIEKLSNHSLAVASLAKSLAINENQNQNIADNTLIAGMLHDTGKLILAQNLPEQYKETLEFAKEKRITIWQAEQD